MNRFSSSFSSGEPKTSGIVGVGYSDRYRFSKTKTENTTPSPAGRPKSLPVDLDQAFERRENTGRSRPPAAPKENSKLI